MSKAQQYRDQSTDELEASCKEIQREIYTLVNQKQQSKKLEKPHRIKEAKRQIARIMTVLNERRRQEQEGSKA